MKRQPNFCKPLVMRPKIASFGSLWAGVSLVGKMWMWTELLWVCFWTKRVVRNTFKICSTLKKKKKKSEQVSTMWHESRRFKPTHTESNNPNIFLWWKGNRFLVTRSFLRCASCSGCSDMPLRSSDHVGLPGNYLTENQITYCLDVSYLRMRQIALRQLGISTALARWGACFFPVACTAAGVGAPVVQGSGAAPTNPPPPLLGKSHGHYFLGWAGTLRQLLNLQPRGTNDRTSVCPSVRLCLVTSKVLLTSQCQKN